MTDKELYDFAHQIANKMLRQGRIPAPVFKDDVVQASLVAALEARKRYDGRRGASFRTFVALRINGAIRDEVARQMRLHVPISYDELAETNVVPICDMTPEKYAIYYDRIARLEKAISKLPEKWQELLFLRHHDDRKNSEIAKKFNVSESRISQMTNSIVAKLRTQV